jgi:WD40 repeat protein
MAVFSPDGNVLATGSGIGSIRLWETATGKAIRQFGDGNMGKVNALAFSPDGTLLASGNSDKAIHLWDAATGKLVLRLAGPEDQVYAMAFALDGKAVAAASAGLWVWEVPGGRLLSRIGGQRNFSHVAFARQGKTLASVEEGQIVWLHELPSGKELRRFPRDGASMAAAFDAAGDLVALAEDHAIHLRKTGTGKDVQTIRSRPGDHEILALSPDGKRLAAAGSSGTMRIWDVATGKEAVVLQAPQSPVEALVIGPGGKVLIAGSAAGRLRMWETASGEPRAPFRGERAPGRMLALSADGKTLACGKAPDGLALWDPASGQEFRQWEGPMGDPACCGAFSPDGKILAVGYLEHPIHLWDPAGTGKPRRLPAASQGALAVCFSPDGQTLSSVAGDGTVWRWEPATGKERGRCHVRAGTRFVFSPDGRILAGGNEDGSISLWDAVTGKEMRHLQGHEDAVAALAFSPDGKALASGGADPTARVWEVLSGQEVRRLSGHLGPVTAVAFFPNSRILVSGSTDTSLLTWDLTGQKGEEPPSRVRLEPRTLEALWARLAGTDGPQAYDALWTLLADPGASVPFLLAQLEWFVGADTPRIARLVADLDDDSYTVREKATADLERLVKFAEPALRKALEKPASLEVQRRIEKILEKLKGGVAWPQERLRLLRTIGVLERLGTPEARRGLASVAERSPDEELGQEAKASLDRLARRPSAVP